MYVGIPRSSINFKHKRDLSISILKNINTNNQKKCLNITSLFNLKSIISMTLLFVCKIGFPLVWFLFQFLHPQFNSIQFNVSFPLKKYTRHFKMHKDRSCSKLSGLNFYFWEGRAIFILKSLWETSEGTPSPRQGATQAMSFNACIL